MESDMLDGIAFATANWLSGLPQDRLAIALHASSLRSEVARPPSASSSQLNMCVIPAHLHQLLNNNSSKHY
eukprot:2566386-Amphidinium_carterae.1